MGLFERALRVAEKKRPIIGFPEASDAHIRTAVHRLARETPVQPVLIGREADMLEGVPLIRTDLPRVKQSMRDAYIKLREAKGKTVSPQEAREAMHDPVAHAMLLLQHEYLDSVITGIAHPTAHTLRWAFRIIPLETRVRKASSFFILEKHDARRDNLLILADCAVQPLPSAQELAEIGLLTARAAQRLGLKPRVAFLSYSTKGSAQGDSPRRVREAVRVFKRRAKTWFAKPILVDGELQVDAALIPRVARRKHAEVLKGRANVLIFPSLDAGNIGYKLIRLFGKYKAYGPFLQGLSKPVADLSRSATAEEVFETALLMSLFI